MAWFGAKSGNAPPAWDGEPVDIDVFWAEAWAELNMRQQALAKTYKLADARWTVDQNAGIIQFERVDGAIVTAPVQIIGSWNPQNEIFTWGWDHPSVKLRLRASAERTRWFGDKHAIPELTEPNVRVSEAEAWRFAAVAMKVNGAHGVYRGPTEGPVVFMTLGAMKIAKAT
jgi:hypothetical protein